MMALYESIVIALVTYVYVNNNYVHVCIKTGKYLLCFLFIFEMGTYYILSHILSQLGFIIQNGLFLQNGF